MGKRYNLRTQRWGCRESARDIIFTNGISLVFRRLTGLDNQKIPKPTIKRLAVYYRCLENILFSGKASVSSKEIADELGIKASQVRKDLSYFGEFGRRGVGYSTQQLLESVSDILGMRKIWNVCIVGMGNLGMALAVYPGLSKSGFFIKALFDNNPNKIGIPIPNDLSIEPISILKSVVKERAINMGVITVPAEVAQETADALVDAGVQGIVNFAPVRLNLPDSVNVEEIDISVSFRSLAFSISLHSGRRRRE